MHTVIICTAGLVLLAVFVCFSHLKSGAGGRAKNALLFIPVWFILALVNAMIGVVSAGYTIIQEASVFLVTFAIPALVAWWLGRRG